MHVYLSLTYMYNYGPKDLDATAHCMTEFILNCKEPVIACLYLYPLMVSARYPTFYLRLAAETINYTKQNLLDKINKMIAAKPYRKYD